MLLHVHGPHHAVRSNTRRLCRGVNVAGAFGVGTASHEEEGSANVQ